MATQADKPRILIVDDIPENVRMLMELLKNDYATIPATNGETALKKARQDPVPDLILLDIIMPVINGYEVCRQLKENPATAHVPVIFITAVSEAMDEAKAFRLGGVDYVTKPFNPVTVTARVKTHIDLARTMRKLKEALAKVKTLSGLLPICSNCKKVRDDKGYWNQIEAYIDAPFRSQLQPRHLPGLRQEALSRNKGQRCGGNRKQSYLYQMEKKPCR